MIRAPIELEVDSMLAADQVCVIAHFSCELRITLEVCKKSRETTAPNEATGRAMANRKVDGLIGEVSVPPMLPKRS